MARMIEGKALVAGEAKGLALVTNEPLSFWGGYDQWTGEIIDRRHPLSGENAKGKVLVVPAAIVTACVDRFFALASIVADEMYAKPIPVVALSEEAFSSLNNGEQIEIFSDGRLMIDSQI